MTKSFGLENLADRVATAAHELGYIRVGGRVSEVAPDAFRLRGLSRHVRLGDRIEIAAKDGASLAEVLRIDGDGVTVKPFAPRIDAGLGAAAWHAGPVVLAPHPSWKGRVIDAMAAPVDGLGQLTPGVVAVPVDGRPPNALRRARVTKPIRTGVRAFDLFTPICAGQRIGIFAGSGVGKSTTLSMIARSRAFDTVVIALVGERGREVREFLDDSLGDNRARSVTVVATGDESPMMRRLAPRTAMAVAEYFRDRGEQVLLIVDSVTRYAHAARDVALAAGEPAVARGYAPSVFTSLPELLERAGPGEEGSGSITGVFAVLVDGDDHNDPVADNIRGTLDGHIVLDRAIADQGRYPAVNVLASISRLAQHVWSREERDLVLRLRSLIARFEDTRDLRLMGGYQAGQDPELDQAVSLVPRIYEGLRQNPTDPLSQDAFRELAEKMQPAPATS
ncbi:flagellar protein export ATPase FliI [Pleomorphomonas sp. NRK KF1]|uniref:flagellar protein export ATPase FliI n=1 Tax=Pleomorphomonas sp. NRK KF1 TaxID=2943000 RepID=UPI0035305730